MEAAVVSMALKVVGNKLAPLLIKQYTSIVGVKRDLEELRDQVVEINGWLETRYEGVYNDPSFNWLKRLKDVAYAIDDVVDEFQLKAEKHAAAADGGIISKYIRTKPKSFILQCKTASKIKKIKRRFAKIVKQRTDYNAITNSISVDPSVRKTNMRTGGMSSWPDVDVSSVVGRDEDKKHIISKLQETDHQLKIKIISVIGLGGSGKTTLAKLVFNDGNINKHFEFTLWVHVSQEFDVNKIIKKMFEAFAENNPGQHGMPYMRKRILDNLVGKRFLLVLDDVWTESQFQWKEFREFLINIGAYGSRILLTTRNSKVAETVGSTDPFKLPLLSEASSWQLFIESCGMDANNMTSEFLDVGKEIVDKCGGVPLAIKVLAGVLRGKEQIDQWKATRDSNLLYVEGEEHRVAACLRLSYFHLPFNLKRCFTICSVFSRGHKIDKEQLIDQWIAHGMITSAYGVDYLEYIGDECFNSPVQMSFLQDVEENYYGRVTCKMHDLIHDLAHSILKDEISLDVPKEATSLPKSYRYFSLIEYPEHSVPKNTYKKTRAADVTFYKHGMALKHAKHLRSITMGSLHEQIVPEAISDVWRLQALHVTQSYSLLEIPESIGKLKKLRTLNLSGCGQLKHLPESIGDCEMISSIGLSNCMKITVLPNTIGKLQKLRTLNLSRCEGLKFLPDSIGDCQRISSIDLSNCRELTVLPDSIGNLKQLIMLNLSLCEGLKCLPDSIGDCQMIASIDLCKCRKLKVLPDSIGKNEKLRVFRLSFTQIERLPSSITTLRNLECLDLEGCFELVEFPEGIGNLEKLQVLNLKNCEKLGVMPVGIGQLSRLQKLGLFVVGKGEKFARISELANIPRISEELTIRGIAHVIEPNDAHMACLKQKTNIQRLYLRWMEYDDAGEANTELEQAILDGLEPPPGIKELEISEYMGRKYARWMQNQVGGRVQGAAPFPFLRVMKLNGFPNLKHVHGLVELPCLEELGLNRMPSLESISGGPFPCLVKLVMYRLPCLGKVWMVVERIMPDEEHGGSYCNFTPQMGQVQVGNCLTYLEIAGCPKLEVKPHLPPSLQYLNLRGSEQLLRSPGQCQGSSSFPSFSHLKDLRLWDMTGLGSGHGWELLQHMTVLESLGICGFPGVQTELPGSLWSLTSLRSLEVSRWSNICALPESLGELRSLQELTIEDCGSLSSLPQSMGQLTSLQLLKIGFCDGLNQLTDCLGELCSLGKLQIIHLSGLTCLTQTICRLTTSLQVLGIFVCPGIKSLLEGIKDLTALKVLQIWACPDLKRRFGERTGEDWHLISHIPDVSV